MPILKSDADKPEDYLDAHANLLLTKKEIARILKQSPRTIEHMMQARSIPYIKLTNSKRGSVRFKLLEVMKVLDRRTVKEVSL